MDEQDDDECRCCCCTGECRGTADWQIREEEDRLIAGASSEGDLESLAF